MSYGIGISLTQGCKIEFKEAVFGGSYKKPKYLGDRVIVAWIAKESYGAQKAQHTFTLLVESAEGEKAEDIEVGSHIRRKGRNLYKDYTVLAMPVAYQKIAEDKHQRGRMAKDEKARKQLSKRLSFEEKWGEEDYYANED